MVTNQITGEYITTCNKSVTKVFSICHASYVKLKASVKGKTQIYVRRDETYPSHNHKVGSTENNITKAEVFQGYRPMDW